MPTNIKKKTDKRKIGKSSLAFNSYLDDYFGLIILVLVLAVFMGSFFFVWYPRLLESIDLVNNTEAQLLDEKAQLERYKNSIIRYKNAYLDISIEDRDKIDDMIGPWYKYPTIYHVDLLLTFQELLHGDNYSLISVKTTDVDLNEEGAIRKKKTSKAVDETADEDLPQGIVGVAMELELENINYDGLKEVLFLLERKLRLTDVVSIDFSPNDETCTIGLGTYRFDSEI